MITTISAVLAGTAGMGIIPGPAAESPLPGGFWEGILVPVMVLAVVVMAVGFLLLVARVSWAAREFVATCRERQRAHRKLVETLSDFMENQNLGVDQIWSASAALSEC